MKITALIIALLLLLIVAVAAARTVFERRLPFVRKLDSDTRSAYIILAIAAIGLMAWSLLDLRVESVDIAGVKATVGELQEKVDTLSEQMEAFFKRKKIEVFYKHNWDRVRMLGKSGENVILEVTLEQEPIPGSVEVYQGVILMPEQDYEFEGRVVRFAASTHEPVLELTIKYFPKVFTR